MNSKNQININCTSTHSDIMCKMDKNIIKLAGAIVFSLNIEREDVN